LGGGLRVEVKGGPPLVRAGQDGPGWRVTRQCECESLNQLPLQCRWVGPPTGVVATLRGTAGMGSRCGCDRWRVAARSDGAAIRSGCRAEMQGGSLCAYMEACRRTAPLPHADAHAQAMWGRRPYRR